MDSLEDFINKLHNYENWLILMIEYDDFKRNSKDYGYRLIENNYILDESIEPTATKYFVDKPSVLVGKYNPNNLKKYEKELEEFRNSWMGRLYAYDGRVRRIEFYRIIFDNYSLEDIKKYVNNLKSSKDHFRWQGSKYLTQMSIYKESLEIFKKSNIDKELANTLLDLSTFTRYIRSLEKNITSRLPKNLIKFKKENKREYNYLRKNNPELLQSMFPNESDNIIKNVQEEILYFTSITGIKFKKCHHSKKYIDYFKKLK